MMVALDQNDFSYKIKYIKFVSHVWRSHFPRFHEYQELMRGFKNSQDIETFSGQMMQFLEGYPDLIEEFNRFMPSGYKINKSPPMSPAPVEILSGKRKQRDDDDEGSVLQKAIGFVNKVKERLPPSKLESFLDIFCSFFKRHKSSSSPDKSNTSDDEVQTLKKVAALLPEDLTQEFTQFLSEVPLFYFVYYYLFYRHKSLSSPDKSNTSGDEVQTFKKVAALLPEDLTQFLSEVSPLSSTSTELCKFETCTPSYPSMTDLSEFETCTPSYRLLPEDFPIPATTRRRKEDSEVLNDRCLCHTAAGGAKEIQSEYEKNQFMCEDERYEYDMTMSNLKSTSKGLKQVWKEMETDGRIRIKDHLSERNLRCIEVLYGGQGLEVRDCLMTNTLVALPVILNRLRQKKQVLKAIWDELNQSWAQLRPVFKH